MRWVLAAVAAWIALSIVVFLLSAQIQQGKIGDDANALLGGASYPLWSPNNVLVLGSDERTADTREPGAQTGRGRADSIMLMRVGGGANSRLSIARDTVVDIPGHGRAKINAAFAFGGTALAIQTVEAYTGVDVNHVVVVSFADFPRPHRRDGRHHLPRRLRRLVHQRRLSQRRLHAAPEGRQDAHRRQAGARPGAHAQERV